MIKPRYLAGQALAYAAFAVTIAYFSQSPAYQHHSPDAAVLKLSLTHAGERIDPCHQRSAAELSKMAPNMRTSQSCGRERHPVTLEMEIDGKLVFAQTAKPAGLSADGRSRFYDSREVPIGRHKLQVRMKDSGGKSYDQQAELDVELEKRQVFVVDFDEEDKRFVFK
jgi:hypothetical protein